MYFKLLMILFILLITGCYDLHLGFKQRLYFQVYVIIVHFQTAVLAQLHHPNIVMYRESFEGRLHEQFIFIVMFSDLLIYVYKLMEAIAQCRERLHARSNFCRAINVLVVM